MITIGIMQEIPPTIRDKKAIHRNANILSAFLLKAFINGIQMVRIINHNAPVLMVYRVLYLSSLWKKSLALRRRTILSTQPLIYRILVSGKLSTRPFIYHISVSGKLSLYLNSIKRKEESQQGFPLKFYALQEIFIQTRVRI